MDRSNFINRISTIVFFTLIALLMQGKTVKSPSLQFNSDGTFKIVQFTDCHYKVDDQTNSQPAIDRMKEVLDAENPDFIIYTGDVVVSCESFKGLDTVLGMAIERNIPYAVVFGNHDDEYDHTRTELYDYIAAKEGAMMPRRTTEYSPDYVVPVKSSCQDDKISALLYCIDSQSYTDVPSVPGYGWIEWRQIDWYRKVSKTFTEGNGGSPLPALAFFHIPLPEYLDALRNETDKLIGVKAEGVCCPTANSGFFLSAKECGDIMATFCGHDHNNDYAVLYKDIMLAYGRYTGGNTVYNDIPNGARVIVLHEGKRTFDTYIRIADGEIENRISYPGSFK